MEHSTSNTHGAKHTSVYPKISSRENSVENEGNEENGTGGNAVTDQVKSVSQGETGKYGTINGKELPKNGEPHKVGSSSVCFHGCITLSSHKVNSKSDPGPFIRT